MKPNFSYNSSGVKYSCDSYRNIKGVHYAHWTSDPNDIKTEIERAKKEGLKYRLIKGELYLEDKSAA